MHSAIFFSTSIACSFLLGPSKFLSYLNSKNFHLQKLSTFLMFEGRAEEALNFYLPLFKNSELLSLDRYEEGQGGPVGKVRMARISLAGQEFLLIDSPIKHAFGFTPAISIFVNCESVEEIDELFAILSAGGNIYMPLEAYPFSERFAWLTDKFGVSWQLTLNTKALNS